jgi:hypothetical protein
MEEFLALVVAELLALAVAALLREIGRRLQVAVA